MPKFVSSDEWAEFLCCFNCYGTPAHPKYYSPDESFDKPGDDEVQYLSHVSRDGKLLGCIQYDSAGDPHCYVIYPENARVNHIDDRKVLGQPLKHDFSRWAEFLPLSFSLANSLKV